MTHLMAGLWPVLLLVASLWLLTQNAGNIVQGRPSPPLGHLIILNLNWASSMLFFMKIYTWDPAKKIKQKC